MINDKIALTTMSQLFAQMRSSEFVCQDEWGEFESDIPCDDIPCIEACTTCGAQNICKDDHECPTESCKTCLEDYTKGTSHTCAKQTCLTCQIEYIIALGHQCNGGGGNSGGNNSGGGSDSGSGGNNGNGNGNNNGNNNGTISIPPINGGSIVIGGQSGITDPCEKAKALYDNQAFKDSVEKMVNDLRAHWPGNNYPEKGWMKTKSGKSFTPSNNIAGSIDYGNDINSRLEGEQITERFHTHPTGGAVPSYSDFAVIMDNYTNGNVDINSYNFGIIDNRSILLITIGDETAFKTFISECNANSKNENTINDLLSLSNNSETMLNILIQELDRMGSGLNFSYSEHEIDYTSNENGILQSVSRLRPISIVNQIREYNDCDE